MRGDFRDEAQRFEHIDRAALRQIRVCNWPKCEEPAGVTVRFSGGIVGQNYYCIDHAQEAVGCGGRVIEAASEVRS